MQEAVEYDLIALGLRLRDVGTEGFSWRDLRVITEQASASSALIRALYPDEADWGLAEQLLAEVADMVRVANWQRGGGKKRDYPDPIPRPGVQPPTKTYGKKPLPLDAMKSWLGWD